METERIVSALHEIHQGHGKTLEEFRSTIAQLKKTISDAVQLREIQNDQQYQERLLQAKLLYGRVQGLERDLEQHVDASEHLVASIRLSVDEKERGRQTGKVMQSLLTSETTQCRQQRAALDNVEVPSEELFLKQAPASLRTSDVLKDPHKLMLNRLAWEYSQRIALREDLDREEKSKKTLGAQAAKAKDSIDKVQEQLAPIFMSAAPIREALPGAIDEIMPQNSSEPILPREAERLSSPLYYVYLNAFCHHACFDQHLDVRIIDDGSSLGNEPCKSALDLFAPHPLSVRLALTDIDYSMVIQYIPRLDIVCVKGEPHSRLLRNVLEGDTGEDSPNPANEYQIDDFDSKMSFGDTLAATSLGQPFRWAQHLAGLDFLPSRKADYALYVRSRLPLGDVLANIRRQVKRT